VRNTTHVLTNKVSVDLLSCRTSLASASSSVYNFVTREDGRRYHAYRAGSQLALDTTRILEH